ncbi:MAG: hypothetical protein EOP45_00015 [Sphingobacteriaceae bacterium]|nr:MAG: hypothetical protein EOP45_00015 [Sphingobacteriaceae bacterium]
MNGELQCIKIGPEDLKKPINTILSDPSQDNKKDSDFPPSPGSNMEETQSVLSKLWSNPGKGKYNLDTPEIINMTFQISKYSSFLIRFSFFFIRFFTC